MTSGESTTGVGSSPVRIGPPVPNPFVIVSDRSRLLVVVVLVSCALTVALTRLFLVLTGYPQVGGSTYHIAHALWGGLALFAAGIIAVVVENRDSAYVVALLTGIGFGLFVDEVGKFITQHNDYFFPLAAPIVYASLLLILAVSEFAGRRQLRSPRAHLLAVISLSQTLADGTVTSTELTAMTEHIRRARQGVLDDASAALLDGIEGAMALADRIDDTLTFGARLRRRTSATLDRWLPVERSRRLARLAMAAFCVFGLVQLSVLVWAIASPGGLTTLLVRRVHDIPVGLLGQVMQLSVLGLGAAVATMAGLSWFAMRPSRVTRRRALRFGYGAMLTLLVLGNLLSSYVDQFAVLLEAALQVGAIGLLARWGRVTALEMPGP
jgi:hypothetical protein